jgi:hypothetical protein
MASESINSSQGEFQDRSQQGSANDSVPHAARGTSATPAPMSWFPLGYREGFSQWVSQSVRIEFEFRGNPDIRYSGRQYLLLRLSTKSSLIYLTCSTNHRHIYKPERQLVVAIAKLQAYNLRTRASRAT